MLPSNIFNAKNAKNLDFYVKHLTLKLASIPLFLRLLTDQTHIPVGNPFAAPALIWANALFFRWKNWAKQKLGDMPKVLEKAKEKTESLILRASNPDHFPEISLL